MVGFYNSMVDNMKNATRIRYIMAFHNVHGNTTLDMYNAKATILDKNISLFRTHLAVHKTLRRWMASISVRNLMSHIGAVTYSIFSPSTTMWKPFHEVSPGAQYFIMIIQAVTGLFVKPINPAYLLSEDYSSQYFFINIAPKISRDKSYSRVKVDATDHRNRNSIWINSDSSEEPYKGIMIKFTCGDITAG